MIPKTLAEAQAQDLDCTFFLNAGEAEVCIFNLKKSGREVIAVIRETLVGATCEHFIVAVKKPQRVVGPLGFPKREKK